MPSATDDAQRPSARPLRPETTAQSLVTLLAGLEAAPLPGRDDDWSCLQIRGVTLDSRGVQPGDLYVGLPGTRTHGASYAAQAAAAGAAALLTDPQGAELLVAADAPDLPVAVVAEPRLVMAEASARLFGHPTRDLVMFGITGTNGKTTTMYLLEAGLRAAGRRVGTIGTIGFRLDGRTLPSTRGTITTPESPDLQALFAVMARGGADCVAMEVSSHALDQHRVAAVAFDVVGFTNLGRDHLDYHPTIEDYFEAKARLFAPGMTRRAVVNGDDPHGVELVRRALAAGGPGVATVGFTPGCDYHIRSWSANDEGGAHLEVDHDGWVGGASFDIGLPGEYNVFNAALALAMIDQAGIDWRSALAGLAHAQVPGRMQRVVLPAGAPRVYVDFAHTPQAIAAALGAIQGGRVIAVLGAGGDRDARKRGPMGRAAALGADVVIVTDDNPRTEDPESIRAAVLAGAQEVAQQGRTVVVLDGGDRQAAIGLALQVAKRDDAVAVLGKGHETTQLLADRAVHFDDVEAVRRAWAQIHGGSQSALDHGAEAGTRGKEER